jgi:hypothetical protein
MIDVIGTFPDLPKPATSSRKVFVSSDASCEVVENRFRGEIV